MRKVLHGCVATCLLWAFVQAPFDHTHDRDPHHEHATGFAHTHPASDHSAESGWNTNDHDSDARSKTWVIATGKPPMPFQALLPYAVVLPALAPQAATAAEPTPKSHDPPWVCNLQSRAPPA